MKYTTSLETFWKWYQLVCKLEVGSRIDDWIRQTQDVGWSSLLPGKLVADWKCIGDQDCG